MISVVVPVFNVEKYLRQSIYSVINQTYKDLEIILVDDGSTDSSGTICDELKQQDDRILVFHQINKGVSSARNYGISKASCDYIAFMDPDDIIDSRMYELLMNQLLIDQSSCSVCRYQVIESYDLVKPISNVFSTMLLKKDEILPFF